MLSVWVLSHPPPEKQGSERREGALPARLQPCPAFRTSCCVNKHTPPLCQGLQWDCDHLFPLGGGLLA